MTIQELHNALCNEGRDNGDLVSFLDSKADGIRRLFLDIDGSKDTDDLLRQIVLRLGQAGSAIKRTNEVQALLTHGALYFRKRGDRSWTQACFTELRPNSRFYNRLRAWMHWQRYNDHGSYVSELDRYLELLTADILLNDVEDTTYDILDDLVSFTNWVREHLPSNVLAALTHLLETEERRTRFPILQAYRELRDAKEPTIRINAHSNQEYTPSDEMLHVFNRAFVDPLRSRSSGFPNRLLGYDTQKIRYDIIRCGQTDFDANYGELLPTDIVLLYCYFNMRKHYCTSLSLFQRSDIFERCFAATNTPVRFIDIGCGPGTAGLAFMEYLSAQTTAAVPIHYFGVDTSTAMHDMADQLLHNPFRHSATRQSFYRTVSAIPMSELDGNGCILLNACYVFASPTLDVTEIVSFVRLLKEAYPHDSVYLFFQNSVHENLNKSYSSFKEQLVNYKVLFSAKETIPYRTKKSFFPPTLEPVFYETLKL